MLRRDNTTPMVERVIKTGMANNVTTLGGILDAAKAWKPHGYDDEIAKRRDYYKGQHVKWLRANLDERYPQTAGKMSAYPVPLFRHLVERQATIYRAAPRREIAGDTTATERVSRLYELALADNRLQVVEQIAAAARVAFIRVAADEDADRLVLTPRWPDTVHVIPDPDWPTDLQRAHALVAEITSAAGVSGITIGNRRYEVWTRGADGWSFARTTGDGSGWTQDARRWQTLPWVSVHYDEAETLYEVPPNDDIECVDAIGCMYTNLNYTIEMQSHVQVWYAGPKPGQKLVGGPGTYWDAGEAGTFGSLTYQPQIGAVKEAAENLIGTWLALHNLNPNSASVRPDYQSGTALKVKSQPMLEARLSRVPLYRELEERWLWPVMREQSAALSGEEWPEGAALKWTPGDLQLPLDDEAEFRLAQGRVAASVSTWPKEMVRLREAPDLETAALAYEDNIAANAKHPVTVGVPFIRSASVGPAMGEVAADAPGAAKPPGTAAAKAEDDG